MTTHLGSAGRPAEPRTDRPWQQAGRPQVSADTTADAVYPYVVYVGAHDPVPVPMTAASLRALRDSLSALLAAPAPAQPDDFVDEWAHHHRAAVYPGDPATDRPPAWDGRHGAAADPPAAQECALGAATDPSPARECTLGAATDPSPATEGTTEPVLLPPADADSFRKAA